MVKILVKLIGKSTVNPLLIVVCVVSVFIAFSLPYKKACRLNQELHDTKVFLTKEKQLCDDLRQAAEDIIQLQNKEIETYLINLDNYQKTLLIRERELREVTAEKQKKIIVETYKDSTADNQLKIITDMLNEFSNELR